MKVQEFTETKLEDEYYIDEEGCKLPEDFSSFHEGDEVAQGSYVVPPGVAVEELKNYNGHNDLKNRCPESVRRLLDEKGLMDVYNDFVEAVVKTKSTRGPLGKWKDRQFISVMDLFRDKFAEGGVKVALCKRRSGKGTYRWLEFIDVNGLNSPYVPQYDVSNLSGQIIKTCYTQLEFPNGVAVEELKQWGGRRKLKEHVPIHVQKMIEKHDLQEEYHQLVDHVVESGIGCNSKSWNIEKLKDIVEVYKPKFMQKGIEIFLCHKQEFISHGQYGGHTEFYRWIEFVDRAQQPSYCPQRDAETKKEGCVVS
mmetsp:Transcript_2411/g.5222  ORF Transcript_2411/g.5222 Transcript_2411/m.5222 type:complete len:309 (+) Transcript_2411:189-1115(+)|eukprot:CAMPEP_0171337802 /NCGR_PEP_ID=MMETSP0878-20121228/6910_1 /TAXON_ID=67004 /ORGANISM="Thalassiosira weissflogii, Strain CCMP1336" /LENGTH=308 /DNA_ID=CAMNT_0011839467 /DNA_START=181 /DNA_END=1107 /DNA_ORIENTATION=+